MSGGEETDGGGLAEPPPTREEEVVSGGRRDHAMSLRGAQGTGRRRAEGRGVSARRG